MNLPDGTHLAYTVWTEMYYWEITRVPGDLPRLGIAASAEGSGGGVAWEFDIEQHELGGKPYTRIRVFDDAYAAFVQIPEFFTALWEQEPHTLDEVRAILDGLGAADETKREE